MDNINDLTASDCRIIKRALLVLELTLEEGEQTSTKKLEGDRVSELIEIFYKAQKSKA